MLNSRAMAIRYAQEKGLDYSRLNLIVAHLGGGISASVHCQGKIIDSLGDDDGQSSASISFSPGSTATGAMKPTYSLIRSVSIWDRATPPVRIIALEYASIYPVKDFYRFPLSWKAILALLILSFSIVILLFYHKSAYVN